MLHIILEIVTTSIDQPGGWLGGWFRVNTESPETEWVGEGIDEEAREAE